MGLNDRKVVAKAFLDDKASYHPFVAKRIWEVACGLFNLMGINKELFEELHKSEYVDEDTVLVYPDLTFDYSADVDGQEMNFPCNELMPEIKKLSPSDYDYFRAIEEGGVEAKVIAIEEKKLFKSGYADWEIKPSQLFLDVVEELKKIAGTEADISTVYGTHADFRIRSYQSFAGEPYREALLHKGDQPEYKFHARIMIRRLS